VQETICRAAGTELTDPRRTAAYVAARAVPPVLEVTAERGPETLARAATAAAPEAWEERVRRWLGSGELGAVDTYVVRAAAAPVLEALGPKAGEACTGPRDERHCPRCGGLPQVSVVSAPAEDLVTPRRYLECARCAHRWPYPRLMCPACGEAEAQRLPIFAEEGTTAGEATGQVIRRVQADPVAAVPCGDPMFPHMSVHACRTCARYLLNVDLGRETRAVPAVDELAAVPLVLYAREQGLDKIVVNLAGF
jgi:FdhE protein